jgi:dUTP pyrophosphatase
METLRLDLRWLLPVESRDLPLPVYHSDNASGMDVAAAIVAETVIVPGQIVLIPTGFAVGIPKGYELQVRPRSGLAIRHGITVVNSPGTIDADYRGEIKIGLINLGRKAYTIRRGDRIAQLILVPVAQAKWQVVEKLDDTSRSNGGFGHTGV